MCHPNRIKNPVQSLWNAMGNSALIKMITNRADWDIQREGRFTDPQDQSTSFDIEGIAQTARENDVDVGTYIMEQLAFQPSSPINKEDDTLRFFVPGLNTPEPESSRRTQYYAENYGQPMAHLHNGTNLDSGLPMSDQIDYIAAMSVRQGLKGTKLMDSMEQVLEANSLRRNQKKSMLCSIPMERLVVFEPLRIFRRNENSTTSSKMPFHQRISKVHEVTKEVEALLQKYVFVELHGNAAPDLPIGPEYLIWTDKEDQMTHNELPFGLGDMGMHGANRSDTPNASYIDYDGPFSGGNSHNLAAGGVHVVKETLQLNGVTTTRELHDLIQSGEPIVLPKNVKGDEKELW